jgi:FG-GAP-like repeat/ASPIC and UnbV
MMAGSRSSVGTAISVMLLCLLIPITGCRHGSGTSGQKSGVPADKFASNREMAKLLQETAAQVNPEDTKILLNRERAAMFKTQLLTAGEDEAGADLHLQYAKELLAAGYTEDGIKELVALEAMLKRISPTLWKANKRTVKVWQAIGWMRLGELQNCCSINTSDSCLLPIKGQGVHSRREGSAKAIALFSEVLAEHPDDMEARWLLNVASMTLGEYPGGVASKWVIPPAAFAAEYNPGRFTNVAPTIGLNLLGRSGGCIIDDFDGDGLLDIMISGIGYQDPLRFFHNNGDGTFTERTHEAGLDGITGGLNMFQADYDNDGHLDLLLLRGGWMDRAGNFPPSLLHNNGDGTFTDVTKKAGLLKFAVTQTAVWLDYDNDGKLDLYVGYESGKSGSHPCALYHNNGDGTFTDVAEKAGVDFSGFVKSVVSADYDNDGWPDLFVSVFGGPNRLYHNNGNGTFTECAEKAKVQLPIYSFGSFFFDYDQDGWPDLFVCGYKAENVGDIAAEYVGKPSTVEKPRLYHNNHDGTFTDVTAQQHLNRSITGMGLNFGDMDNDGYPDIYIGTGNPDLASLVPNRAFRNDAGKRFQEVTTSMNTGHLQKGHAVCFADINNDGQQDLFAQQGGAYYGDIAYSALFANPGHKNHWITLQLEGVRTNRSAIGARIKVVVKQGNSFRNVYHTVGSGASFGANPLRAEIGLGGAASIDHLEIYWPVTRSVQQVAGSAVAMDSFWSIKEGGMPVKLSLKSFSWPKSD